MQDKYYLSMQEAAEKAGISYVTLKRYVRDGRVMPQKIRYPHATGYRYLFSDREVQHAREIYEHNITSLRIGLYEHLQKIKGNPDLARAIAQERKWARSDQI